MTQAIAFVGMEIQFDQKVLGSASPAARVVTRGLWPRDIGLRIVGVRELETAAERVPTTVVDIGDSHVAGAAVRGIRRIPQRQGIVTSHVCAGARLWTQMKDEGDNGVVMEICANAGSISRPLVIPPFVKSSAGPMPARSSIWRGDCNAPGAKDHLACEKDWVVPC